MFRRCSSRTVSIKLLRARFCFTASRSRPSTISLSILMENTIFFAMALIVTLFAHLVKFFLTSISVHVIL